MFFIKIICINIYIGEVLNEWYVNINFLFFKFNVFVYVM